MRMWTSCKPSTLKDIYIQLHEDNSACLHDFTNIYTSVSLLVLPLMSFCAVLHLSCHLGGVWTNNALLFATIKKKSMLNFNGVHQGF